MAEPVTNNDNQPVIDSTATESGRVYKPEDRGYQESEVSTLEALQKMNQGPAPTNILSSPETINPNQQTIPSNISDVKVDTLDVPPYETVKDLADQAFAAGDVAPISNYTKTIIDYSAEQMNKMPFNPPNNNLHSDVPGKATANYNPFEQNTGMYDRSTPQGASNAFLNQVQQDIYSAGPKKNPAYKDPFHFGAERYNFDRYYRHPRFSDLGFNPFADNESYYQAKSSKWDNFTRTRGAFSDTFGPAFTSSWRAIGDFVSGGSQSFSSDFLGAKAMMDGMRIGRSGSGGTRGFFNDLFLNGAYTMGIIGSIAVEELVGWGAALALTAPTGGGSLALKGADTARKAVSFADRMKTIFDVRKYMQATKTMLNTMDDAVAAKNFWQMSRAGMTGAGRTALNFFAPETMYAISKLKTAAQKADNLSMMAKASTLFGGFYRDVRALNMALAEAKMEAGIVELDLQSELHAVRRDQLGRNLTLKESMDVAADASTGAMKTLMINAPIIYLSNKLILDGAIRGWRPMGQIIDNSLSGLPGRVGIRKMSAKEYAKAQLKKKTTGEAIKVAYDRGEYALFQTLRRMHAAGVAGGTKHMAAVGLRYAALNSSEGFQEIMQEATSFGVKAHWHDIYASHIMADMEVQTADIDESWKAGYEKYSTMGGMLKDTAKDIFTKSDDRKWFLGGKYSRKGMESQMSKEGFHVFMSGFLMGGMVQLPQNILFQGMPNLFNYTFQRDKYNEYVKDRDQWTEQTVNTINEGYNDFERFFDKVKTDAAMQKILNQRMYGNAFAGNIRDFMNDRDHATFIYLQHMIKTGHLKLFQNQLEGFKSLDDSDLKDVFGNRQANAGKLRQRLDAMIKRSYQIEKDVNDLKDKIINPINLNDYEKGSKEYDVAVVAKEAFEQSKDMLIFSKDAFRESIVRTNKIFEKLSQDPVVSKMSNTEIQALLSKKNLKEEIQALRGELTLDANTVKLKEIQKQKAKKLKILEEFESILYNEKYRGPRAGFLKKHIGKLRPTFERYLKLIAEQQGGRVEFDKLDDALEMIIDHEYLGGRAEDFSKAAQNLLDPDHMFKTSERLAKTLMEVYKQETSKNAILKRVKKYVAQKEKMLFLRLLADRGIQPDSQETKEFFETGKIPDTYFDENGPITKDIPEAQLRWAEIEEITAGMKADQAKETAATGTDPIVETRGRTKAEDKVDMDSWDLDDLDISDNVNTENATPVEKSKDEKITTLQEYYDNDINTRTIMKYSHDIYTNRHNTETDGAWLDYSKWKRKIKTNLLGGGGILKSRYELYQKYQEESPTTRAKLTFDQWMNHKDNKVIVSEITDKNSVKLSDISITLYNQTGLKKDKTSANEIEVPAEKLSKTYDGIKIIEVSLAQPGQKTIKVYEVVDVNNDNLSVRNKNLDPDFDKKASKLKTYYRTLKQAEDAASFIDRNAPIDGFEFDMFGIPGFKTGQIWKNSLGQLHVLRTAEAHYDNPKDGKPSLYYVPVGKLTESLKNADPAYVTSKAQFEKEGWELVEKADVPLTQPGVKKLPLNEPIKFYAFDPARVLFGKFLGLKKGISDLPVTDEASFQTWIQNLTDKQKADLKLVVERNPDYDNYKKAEKEKRFRPYDEQNKQIEGDENTGLKAGANEFEITLVDKKNRPIAKLRNIGLVTLVDTDGTKIRGSRITPEQAERLFNIKNENDVELIRNRYSSLENINQMLKRRLGNKSETVVKLSSLKQDGTQVVDVVTTIGWAQHYDKKGAPLETFYDDLKHSTYNYKGKEYVVIYDIRKEYNDKGGFQIVPTAITNIDSAEVESAIEQEIIKEIAARQKTAGEEFTGIQDVNLGRYVQFIKTSDGVITWFKLRPNALTSEEIGEKIEKLKSRQVETLEKNFKDGELKAETKRYKPLSFNQKWNNDFNSEFYIQLNPLRKGAKGWANNKKQGEVVQFNVTHEGQIQISYWNMNDNTIGRKGRGHVYLTKEKLSGINSVKDFLNLINKMWNDKQLSIEAAEKKKGRKGYKKIPLTLTEQDFIVNLEDEIDADSLTANVKAQIIPEIRKNRTINITYTNPSKKAATQGRDLSEAETNTSKTETEEEQTVEYVDITDQKTEDWTNGTLSAEESNTIEEQVRHKKLKGVETTENEDFIWSEISEEIETQSTVTDENFTTYQKLETKELQLATKKLELRDKLADELQAANPNASNKVINAMIDREVAKNEEVKKLEEEVRQLKEDDKNTAPKILPNGQRLDSLQYEKLDEFRKFAIRVLPDYITVEEIDQFVSRMKVHGYMPSVFAMELNELGQGLDSLRGRIFTTDTAPYKYHEAFHAVFRMLLSEAQQSKFLRLGKKGLEAQLAKEGKTLSDAIKEFRIKSSLYLQLDRKTLIDRMAEEWLADEFQNYKLNPTSSKAPSEVKSWFRRLIDWILSFFSQASSKSEIERLFEEIDTGKFKNAKPQVNLFTQDMRTGVPQVAPKIIQEGRKIMYRPIRKANGKMGQKPIIVKTYIPQDVQNRLVGTVASIFIRKLRNVKGPFSTKVLLNDSISEYIQTYNTRDDFFQDMDPKELNRVKPIADSRYEAFKNNRKDIFEAVEEYIELFDIKISNKDQVVEDPEFGMSDGIVRSTDQYDVKSDEIGGWKSLSSGIRKFMATVMVRTTDEFGRTVMEPVDFVDGYNGALKAVQNTTDATSIIQKLSVFSESNPNTRAIVDAILTEAGLDFTHDEIQDPEWTLPQNENGEFIVAPGRGTFFQSIIKGFTNFRLDYMLVEVDKNSGALNLYPANKKDDANSQMDIWMNAFAALYPSLTENKNNSKARASWNSLKKLMMTRSKQNGDPDITNSRLEKRSKKIAEDILNTTGVKLNPKYIEFIVIRSLSGKLTKKQETLKKLYSTINEEVEIRDIDRIIKALGIRSDVTKKYAPVLFDRHSDTLMEDSGFEAGDSEIDSSVRSRLQKMARGNANFDETIGTTVFRNAEGKLIYAHQQPSLHMEKLHALNNPLTIAELKKDPYFEDHYLLDDKRFLDMMEKGLIRLVRISGYKYAILKTGEDGSYSINAGLQSNRKTGVTFGDSSGREFISQLVNMYFAGYDPVSGKMRKGYKQDYEDGDYTIAPVDIRVIEAASTGDFVGLPIRKTVYKDQKGDVQFEEEYIDDVVKEVKREYNAIRNNRINLYDGKDFMGGSTENYDLVENDTDTQKARWKKLNKTRELLIKRTKSLNIKRSITTPPLRSEQKKQIKDKKLRLVLKTDNQMKRVGIFQGETISSPIEFTKTDKVNYSWTNKGSYKFDDLDFEYVMEMLGDMVEKSPEGNKHEIRIGDEIIYTNDNMIAKWLRGDTSYHVLEITDISDSETALEETGDVNLYKTDTKIAEDLENYASMINPETITEDNPNGLPYTFEEAVDKIGIDTIEDLIKTKLDQDFREFKIAYNDLEISKLVNRGVREGLRTTEDIENEWTKISMEDLFLEEGSQNHNLRQIFFNDYMNTKGINQVLLGNTAMTLKDAIDEIKRAKMQNAAGPSAESLIAAPEMHIHHRVDHLSAIMFHDPVRRATGNEKTDGQIYGTVKAFQYMFFGFGRLTPAQSDILERIKRGETITFEEFFGDINKGIKGFKELNAILNSKKLVYGDGKVFLKMSFVPLTKELTSDPATNFTTAKKTRVGLHNLRVNLEGIENKPGAKTLGIAIPTSSSKMLKQNVITSDQAIAEGTEGGPADLASSVVPLRARYMRLQQINPSNKNENVDPKQIKNLITSEQDDSVIVNIAGEDMSIGYLRKMYNQETTNRHLNKYIDTRNLIWTFKTGQDELQKSIDLGQVTTDLSAFRDFALASLEASHSKAQMMELFSGNHSLNNPLAIGAYQRLFFAFFNKEVYGEKQAGHTISLMSDWWVRVIKKVVEVDKKTGQPTKWEVIRDEDYYNTPIAERESKWGKMVKEDWDNQNDRTFNKAENGKPVFKKGDLYIDSLRDNVSDGKNKYTEFLLPAHFAEMMNLKPGDPIPKVLADMFAVRIPSQDKHSSVNLKLVGFLPVYYGSTGVFPEEMLDRSGADFDIDKVFAQIKEWYYDKVKGFVEYGDGIKNPNSKRGRGVNKKTNQQLYDEYRMYQMKEIDKRGSTMNRAYKEWRKRNRQDTSEYEVVKEFLDVELEWTEWMNQPNEDGVIRRTLPYDAAEAKEEFADEKGYPFDKEAGEFMDVTEKVVITEEVLDGVLAQLGKPYTKKQYEAFKKKHNGREPYTAPQSNILLDIKRQLQGNPIMTDPSKHSPVGIANEPAVVEPLVKILEWMKNEIPIIAEAISEEGLDVDNLLGKLNAWVTNHEGADNIGAVVIPNLVVNLLSEFDIAIRKKKSVGVIKINGVEFRNFSNQFGEVAKGKYNEQRTQFVISALITAMTDNAKERLAGYLGLNRDALGVVTGMTALGVPIKDSILMINHPTIKHFYFQEQVKEDGGNIAKAIRFYLEDKNEEDRASAAKIGLTTGILKDQIETYKFVGGIRQNIDQEMDEADKHQANLKEIKVLTTFLRAHQLKKYIGYITHLMRLQAGLGENTQAIETRDFAFDELGIYLSDKQFEKTSIPFDVRGLFNGKEYGTNKVIPWQSSYFKTYSELVNLLPTVFVHRTRTFTRVSNVILDNLNPFRVKPENKYNFQKSILSGLTALAYINHLKDTGQGQKLQSLRNGLIYDEIDNGKLTIREIMKQLKEDAPESVFINKYIYPKLSENPVNKSGINEVISNTWNKMNEKTMIEVERDIIELYTNDVTRRNLEHLINYLIVKDGLSFAQNSFINFIPVPLLEEVISSIEPVHQLFLQEDISPDSMRKIFGFTLNEITDKISKSILMSSKNTYFLNEIRNPLTTFGFRSFSEENNNSINKVISEEDSAFDISQTVEEGLEKQGTDSKGIIRGVTTEKKLSNKGHIIEIGNDRQQYKILSSKKITKQNSKDKKWISNWSKYTGYSEEYFDAFFGVNDDLQVGSYLTILEKQDEKQEADKIISLGPAYYSKETELFKIFLFAPSNKKWDRTSFRGRKKSRVTLEKQALQKLEANIYQLEKQMGMEFVKKKYTSGGRTRDIRLMKTPLITHINIGTFEDPEYIFLELIGMRSPFGNINRQEGDVNAFYDLESGKEGETILSFEAIYKKFEPEGPMSQTDIAGVLPGKRTSHAELRQKVYERDNSDNEDDWDLFDDLDEDAMDTEDTPTTVTEKGYTNKKGEEVPLSEVEKMSNKVEKKIKEPDTDFLDDDIELDENLEEETREDETIKDQMETDQLDAIELKTFYDGLTETQKETIKENSDIKSYKDLLALYRNPNNFLSLEEFKEDIKNCKGS